MVCARSDELIDEIAIGAMHLHAVELGGQRIFRGAGILADEVRHLLDLQRPGPPEWCELALAPLVLDERIAGRRNGRRRHRQHVVRLKRRMRDASDMPELQEYPA